MGRSARISGRVAALMAAFALSPPGIVQAAPVDSGALLAVEIQGLGAVLATGAGELDIVGDRVRIPAGIVTLPVPITIPVTATSAVASLVVSRLSNLSGTVSGGGVRNQFPEEICPTGGPAPGQACNRPDGSSAGFRIGGAMGLTGTIFVHVLPNTFAGGIPFNLNAMRIGRGGAGDGPFTTDAALWTLDTGLVDTGANTLTVRGGLGTQTPFTLVTPTYVLALGNLLPVFATFTLTNLTLPEPGALAMLTSGVAGLLALRRVDRRSC